MTKTALPHDSKKGTACSLRTWAWVNGDWIIGDLVTSELKVLSLLYGSKQ